MALGTVTSVVIDPHSSDAALPVVVGDLKLSVVKVVGEASYTTGGASITAAQLGFPSGVVAAQAEVFASTGSNATSAVMTVVPAAGGGSANLKCFTSANVEIASTTNVSGITWQIVAFGY